MGLNSSEPQGSNSLSPDLARHSPEHFTNILRGKTLQRLGTKPIAVIAQMAEIKIQPDTWVCETTKGPETPIKLGTQPVPQSIYKQVIFEGHPNCPRSYEDMTIYRFTHELTHKLIGFLKSQDDKRLEILTHITEAQHEGQSLTRFSMIDNQGNPNGKGLEDFTELVNMYLWDPEYLKNYLSFLTTPQAISLGLTSLNSETATILFESIQEIAEQ